MDVALTKWCLENKLDLVRVASSTDTTYLSGRLPSPYTEENADEYIKEVIATHDDIDGVYRAIIYKGKIVGTITIEPRYGIYSCDSILGYFLDKEYFGHGIATEATRQICKLAFDMLQIARISTRILAPNIASRRVVEKCGFKEEGIIRSGVIKEGKLYDVYMFGLTREDYSKLGQLL